MEAINAASSNRALFEQNKNQENCILQNDKKALSKPLLSRFKVLTLLKYPFRKISRTFNGHINNNNGKSKKY